MNRLITDLLGKMPIFLDDFNFIQNNLIDALNSIIKSLVGNQPCRLTGCEFQAGNSVTEGFVWLEGEICYVPAQQVESQEAPPHIILNETTTNPRIFGDGTTHNVWLIRQGLLRSEQYQDCENHQCIYYNTPYLKDLIVPKNGEWQTPQLQNNWYDRPEHRLRYRKTLDNHLEITGIAVGNSATDTLVFVSQYQPTKEYDLAITVSGAIIGRIVIKNNGEVHLMRTDSTNLAGDYFVFARVPLD